VTNKPRTNLTRFISLPPPSIPPYPCPPLQSSAIVLMIGGVMKELLTIFLGVLIFRERVSTQAWVGFAIVTSGVVVYKFDKAKGKAGSEEGERKKDGRGQRIAGTDETEDEDMLELMSWTQGGDEDEDFSN